MLWEALEALFGCGTFCLLWFFKCAHPSIFKIYFWSTLRLLSTRVLVQIFHERSNLFFMTTYCFLLAYKPIFDEYLLCAWKAHFKRKRKEKWKTQSFCFVINITKTLKLSCFFLVCKLLDFYSSEISEQVMEIFLIFWNSKAMIEKVGRTKYVSFSKLHILCKFQNNWHTNKKLSDI